MPANCICQDLAYLLLSTHHFLLLSGCNKSTHPLLTLDARHHLVNVAGSSLSPHFSIFPHITYNIYVYRLGAFRHIIFYVLGGDSDWEISIISPRQWLSFPPSLVFFSCCLGSAVSSTWVDGIEFTSWCWHCWVTRTEFASSCICLRRQVWLENAELATNWHKFPEGN